MKQLPFFYHVPKNAGTYFLSYALAFARFYVVDTVGYPAIKYLRNISIKDYKNNHKAKATLIAVDTEGFCQKSGKIKKTAGSDQTLYWISYSDFETISLDALEPVTFILESHGFCNRNEMLKKMKDYQPFECLIDREPLSRQKSLYRYLTSVDSQHELTHGNFSNSISFYDYIKRHAKEEDCWLIRAFLGKYYPETISMDDFNNLCKILDNVYILDIRNTQEFINHVYNICYGADANSLIKKYNPQVLSQLYKNESSNKQPIYDPRINEIREHLFWAYLVYNKYSG